MADKVDVKLKAVDQSGVTTTTTITYINPNATNSEMKSFAQRLNAFTTNTYKESDKVETTNLDLAPVTRELITPTFVLDVNFVTLADVKAALGKSYVFKLTTLTYNGDGTPFAYGGYSNPNAGIGVKSLGSNKWEINLTTGSANFVNAGTVHIRVDATDVYKAAELTFEITE